MKRLAALVAAAALCFSLAGCAQGGSAHGDSLQDGDSAQEQENLQEQAPDSGEAVAGLVDAQTGAIGPVILYDPYASGIHHATLTIQGYDSMEVEIYSSTAPETSALFCKLVRQGYYDGLSLTSLMPGLYAGISAPSDDSIEVTAEFEEAGYNANPIGLKRGVIAMGRASVDEDVDGPHIIKSDASELYVFLTDASYLDGTYAGFAKITQGMATFDAICADVQRVSSLKEDGTIKRAKSAPIIKSIELED